MDASGGNRIDRRDFLKRAALASASMCLPLNALAGGRDGGPVLTILHTNDVHSRIDPFPENDRKFPGLGGASRRAELIDVIRRESDHVLLLDAGDIVQGTPYFNFFEGELEYRLMDEMGYDAATIGNHDFDAGIDVLATRIASAGFPMVNCNYKVRGTALESLVRPYHIIGTGPLKIGLTGLGVRLDGLVSPRLYGGVKYEDPVNAVNDVAAHLKHHLHCDYVIVLSHLGHSYSDDRISDLRLAAESVDIDLIIGGHTHTFLDQPATVNNRNGLPVVVNQAGWAGVWLGRLDVAFDRKKKKKSTCGQTVVVDKKSRVN